METLSSIPILPALRLNAVSNPFHAFDDLHVDSESYSERHGSDDEDSESKLPDLEDGHKEPGVPIQTDIQGTIIPILDKKGFHASYNVDSGKWVNFRNSLYIMNKVCKESFSLILQYI